MSRNHKTGQLRVRLTRPERETLDRLLIERGRDETLSDLVREALGWLIDPGQGKVPVYLSSALGRRLMDVARELHRDHHMVAEETLGDIFDLIEKPTGRAPLVVQEIQLRRAYRGKQG